MEQETLLDFNVIFNTLPGNHLVVQPNPPRYTILAASDDFLNSTGRSRNEVLGKPLFEVYPENSAASSVTGLSHVAAALQQVIDTKEPNQLPGVRLQVRTARDGQEVRQFTVLNKPVPDRSGKIRYILQTFTSTLR